MPSLVRVGVSRARDLPIMDSSVQGDASTDAFVEVRLGDDVKRTNTIRKSLNPEWNEDFIFEVIDDSLLQDAPLELRVVDQDLYSSELIGIVYIDLNPLISRTIDDNDKSLTIKGWFPLFDTLKGLRGDIYVSIKLQFIGNDNPFKDSSAGVQFFAASVLSTHTFAIQDILGFVADLVVDDDPEGSWQDYFRKSGQRSNESRQKVLYGLSAEVRREVGKKVLDMGGNAVLGFHIHFDLEGASGLVVRAYGTACNLLRVVSGVSSGLGSLHGPKNTARPFSPGDSIPSSSMIPPQGAVLVQGQEASTILTEGLAAVLSESFVRPALRRQSTADRAALAAHEDTLTLVPLPLGSGLSYRLERFGPAHIEQTQTNPGRLRDLGDTLSSPEWMPGGTAGPKKEAIFGEDVMLISMNQFDKHVQVRLGGLVVARSVKFLGKLEATLTDQETREGWWEDLRDEIKGHARTLCCTHIIGYQERCSLVGDVCVLSGEGTAAVLKSVAHPKITSADWGHTNARDVTGDGINQGEPSFSEEKGSNNTSDRENEEDSTFSLTLPPILKRLEKKRKLCTAVHVPYNRKLAPFSFMRIVPCAVCRRKWVPEVVLSTTQLPDGLPIRGEPRLLEARICRERRRDAGEKDATKVSEVLPFVEFDLQRQLMLKLKVTGLNAAFGYKSNVRVGGSLVVAVASCTAVFVTALPSPPQLTIAPASSHADRRMLDYHLHLEELAAYHKTVLRRGGEQSRFKTGAHWNSNSPRATALKDGNPGEESLTRFSSSSSSSSSSSNSSSNNSSSSDSSDSGSESGSSSSSLESPSSSSSSGSEGDDSSSSSSNISDDENQKRIHRAHRRKFGRERRRHNEHAVQEGRRARLRRMLLDERAPTVVEIDEETDADIEAVLSDWMSPLGVSITNLESIPSCALAVATQASVTDGGHHKSMLGPGQQIVVMKRLRMPTKQEMTQSRFSSKAAKKSTGNSSDSGVGHSDEGNSLAGRISSLFYEAYLRMCHVVRTLQPCVLLGVAHSMHVLDDGVLEVLFSAAAHPIKQVQVHAPLRIHPILYSHNNSNDHQTPTRTSRSASIWSDTSDGNDGSLNSPLGSGSRKSGHKSKESRARSASVDSNKSIGSTHSDASQLLSGASQPSNPSSPSGSRSGTFDYTGFSPDDHSPQLGSPIQTYRSGNIHNERGGITGSAHFTSPPQVDGIASAVEHDPVLVTSLPVVPGTTIKRYLGPVHVHVVKDSDGVRAVRNVTSLEKFFFILLSEAGSVLRAQVTAMGGNALVCHRISPQESSSRSGHYNMVSVSGDAVLLERDEVYEALYRDAKPVVE